MLIINCFCLFVKYCPRSLQFPSAPMLECLKFVNLRTTTFLSSFVAEFLKVFSKPATAVCITWFCFTAIVLWVVCQKVVETCLCNCGERVNLLVTYMSLTKKNSLATMVGGNIGHVCDKPKSLF